MKRIIRLFALTLALALSLGMMSSQLFTSGSAVSYAGGFPGSGEIVAHGLDVSAWQESGLDFQNIANAGYDFVILRCGTSVRKDVCFEEYYRNAKAAGLDVGCYFYSYATTAAQARQEAYDVLEYIKGKTFEYPIYFDFEDPTQVDLSYSLSADICRAFLDVLQENRYLGGLYSMSWILNRSWVSSSGISSTYEGWVAHVYSDANNTGITSGEYNIYKDRYCSVYGMHQYSFTTYVNGVGPFDANVSYKDYPSIVMANGLNGYQGADTEAPVISDVVYSDVSAAGYTITCTVKDNYSVSRVSFPTWTVHNGQDDLPAQFMATQQGTRNGDKFTFRVNASAHNNETGSYVTHIYAEDRAGNVATLNLDAVTVRNDTQNPVISDVVYSDLSSKGYTVTCTVTDDWGVNSVSFPTWTVANGQDDLPAQFLTTQLGVKNGNRYTFRVNTSDHNNETGGYVTHIYATDCAGNRVSLPLGTVQVMDDTEAPVITDAVVSNITAEGYTVTCKVTDNWGIHSVVFPTWTSANGQDDLAQDFFNTQVGTKNGNTFTFEVKAADHNNETGSYITHIYATDCAGNRTQLVLDAVNVQDPVQIIVPEVTAKSFSLSFDDEILVNYYYTVSDMTDVQEQGMLVFDTDPGVADIAKADDVYTGSTYVESSNRYMNTTEGIAAKYIGDTRYYASYVKLTDGSYVYSKVYDYSPRKYAMNMLSKTSTSDKQKDLCVAMLNYGAAAQSYFGYKTGDLANASLTAEQKARVTPYARSMFTGAVASTKGTDFAATSGFSKKSVSVSFESAFAINFYMAPASAVAGDMTLYIWTPQAYAEATRLTAQNAIAVPMTCGDDGRYFHQISGIAAKALDDTYYVAAVYTDANGATQCSGVIAYSLSKYCLNNAVEGKAMQELASATAMYGYYAKQYFAN
jgi:hypothetical protein